MRSERISESLQIEASLLPHVDSTRMGAQERASGASRADEDSTSPVQKDSTRVAGFTGSASARSCTWADLLKSTMMKANRIASEKDGPKQLIDHDHLDFGGLDLYSKFHEGTVSGRTKSACNKGRTKQ